MSEPKTPPGRRVPAKPDAGPPAEWGPRVRWRIRLLWTAWIRGSFFLMFRDLPLVGLLHLLLVPVILLAVSAEALAWALGGTLRAMLSFGVLCFGLGLVMDVVLSAAAGRPGDPMMIGLTAGAGGAFAGLVVGFLAGPIFRELPAQLDRELLNWSQRLR